MGKPLPLETRRVIVRMIEKGDCSQEDIAKVFNIGHRSVQRYWAMHCQTGDVDSYAKFGGHKKAKLAQHADTVHRLIKERADITIDALRRKLQKQGLLISKSALHNFIRALGYSNKKNGIWS